MPRPTNMKTKTRFGVLICNQLSKMGKNQKDLAQESGLSPFYVSEILNGKHNPICKGSVQHFESDWNQH